MLRRKKKSESRVSHTIYQELPQRKEDNYSVRRHSNFSQRKEKAAKKESDHLLMKRGFSPANKTNACDLFTPENETKRGRGGSVNIKISTVAGT